MSRGNERPCIENRAGCFGRERGLLVFAFDPSLDGLSVKEEVPVRALAPEDAFAPHAGLFLGIDGVSRIADELDEPID